MGDYLYLDEQNEALIFWKPTKFPKFEEGQGLNLYRQITVDQPEKFCMIFIINFP